MGWEHPRAQPGPVEALGPGPRRSSQDWIRPLRSREEPGGAHPRSAVAGKAPEGLGPVSSVTGAGTTAFHIPPRVARVSGITWLPAPRRITGARVTPGGELPNRPRPLYLASWREGPVHVKQAEDALFPAGALDGDSQGCNSARQALSPQRPAGVARAAEVGRGRGGAGCAARGGAAGIGPPSREPGLRRRKRDATGPRGGGAWRGAESERSAPTEPGTGGKRGGTGRQCPARIGL